MFPEKTPGDMLSSPFFSENYQNFGFIENSPFKFYNNNTKLRYMNRIGGMDDLSSILKSSGNFVFPTLLATPLLKSSLPSELEDKNQILDTAKIAALLSDNRVFTFPTETKEEERDQQAQEDKAPDGGNRDMKAPENEPRKKLKENGFQ
jgi:hypothetical protein